LRRRVLGLSIQISQVLLKCLMECGGGNGQGR
jgi:hypothetical protein